MRNLRTDPFETYRKQAQSLEVDTTMHDKTMEKIRNLEKQGTSSERTAHRLSAPKTIPALQVHKRRSFPATPFKVAACLALVAGVGGAALSPALFQQDVNQQAVADAPLYPFHRIQFDFYYESDLIKDGKVYHATPLLLTLPGDLPDNYSVRFERTGGIFFASQHTSFDQLSRSNVVEVNSNNEGRLYLEAWYSTDYDANDPSIGSQPPNEPSYGGSPPPGWTMDPTVAIETLTRLQECEISVISKGKVLDSYTINFTNCHTKEEITERLHSSPSLMAYFLLDRKG